MHFIGWQAQGSFALVIWENASTGGYRGAENGTPMLEVSAYATFCIKADIVELGGAAGSSEPQCGRNAVRRQQCDLRLDADHCIGIQGEPILLPHRS